MWLSARKFWEFGAAKTAIAAFCAHSVSISIGICQAYSAILIPQLDIDPEKASWLASLGAITNPLGSIISGLLAEYFGRKRSIQISSFPFVIGWLCIGFAEDIRWLYIGRLITGIATGMSTASYTYVSEISPPHSRGFHQSLGPICASFGILSTYIMGYFLHWSLIAFISVSFSLFTLFAVQCLPETPPYLSKKRRPLDAYHAHLWLRRSVAEAEAELANQTREKDEATPTSYMTAVKPFLLLITLFFLQELSGIYTILYYAVNFFEETDLDVDNYLASIILGVIRFGMSIIAAFLINQYGRKILCVWSSAGMSVTMLVMAGYFKFYEINTNLTKMFPLLPLSCVILNVMFSMMGMLPIPWILVGELFPLSVRSIMSGLVICIAQSFIFLFVKIYPAMIEYLNFSGTLFTFFLAALLALLFSKLVLPETKNKSLDEIEDSFKKKDYDNPAFVA